MNILGVVAYTMGYGESCAALSVDGNLVGVVEEERFTRRRYEDGFPRQAIAHLLQRGGITGAQIDHVALHFQSRSGLGNRLYWMARSPWQTLTNMGTYWRYFRLMGGLESELIRTLGHNRFHLGHFDHHLCHAAAAFYTSPFERAAFLTLDGSGEGVTGTIGTADRGEGLSMQRRFAFPHSLGFFYSAVCDFVGYPPPAGPGKMMGLAPYGDPERFLPLMRQLVGVHNGHLHLDLDHFLFHRNLATPLDNNPWMSPRFERATGLRRRAPGEDLTPLHIDLIAALQARTNEVGLELARLTAQLTGARHLCLAGGVALNSVMNDNIWAAGLFEAIHVQPAPGDGGNALGAVLLAGTQMEGRTPIFDCMPYAGPDYSDQQIQEALQRSGLSWRRSADVVDETARAIKRGAIIGWMQGRMEYGPRALGNRSILADPQNPKVRDLINFKVKKREWFRPFAPSVTLEAGARYFHGPAENPYMLFVAQVRPEWREHFPGITHVDGSARVQTVSVRDNPRFHALLTRLGEIHNHPMVLNTSFNKQEPIVCSPEDALRCFKNTEIDFLVMGDWICEKPTPDADPSSS